MNSVARTATRVYGWRWIVLPPTVGIAMLAMIVGAMVVAPREAVEGEVQRIFYIHVPSAIAAYLAFFIVFVSSIAVLWRRDMRFDVVARAAAGVGVLFTGLVLATGAIWGHPIWGTWWAWDARLTSTLILFLIFSGYLLARSLSDTSDEQSARYGAVFAIIGFLDIPIINMSVRWWRTLHPQPIVLKMPGEQALPGSMLAVLWLGMVAILLLALWFIVLRSETERIATRVNELRVALDRDDEG
ncbi:MAG: cytochrome c biogenesis protein CcsA [Dehalococcoidia bacterium]|nr:cytochrome c biogenesis protein CcsA [Dehalococcoidia bacterium]